MRGEDMLKEKFDLTGKTAFVTGSARGIGRAIALGFAEYGARVIVHGSRPSEALSRTLADVRAFAPDSEACPFDLSDPAAVAANCPREVDVLVCNASVQSNLKWDEVPLETMLTQMQVNFNATFQMFQAVHPHMKARGWGRLITVGSVQEFRPHPEMPVYAASKSAQENLVRNVARQVAREGITVNNLCPGVFATDRNAAALSRPDYAERVFNAIPLHFAADAEDAAGAALLLATDAGRYITGANLVVDGGLRLPG